MKKFITIALLLLSLNSFSQTIEKVLNGFSLGQYREVPKNELGKIIKSGKFDDGFEYEAFLVEPDGSVYMIFEYANVDLNLIWSAQLTGNKKGFDCGFKGLKLGMTTDEVIKILGKPSSIEDAGEYGYRWGYDKRNYSVEISPNKVLQGIKLIDMSQEFFPEQDIKNLPDITDIRKVLKTKNRKEIVKMLAPGMEIYKNDSVYYFKKPIEEEIKSDCSGIFGLLNETSDFIKKVNTRKKKQYEENMRLILNQGTQHVAKFRKKNKYYEIVFKYIFGEYLIWEVKMN